MADDEGDQPKKKGVVELASLKSPTGGMKDVLGSLAGKSALSDFAGKLAGSGKLLEQMEKQRAQFAALTRPSPMMENLNKQIESQRKLLDSFSRPGVGNLLEKTGPEISIPRLPDLPPLPRNPILDTNEKLSDIGEQFEKMFEVMVNAANIATDIQSNAAGFIDKFEEASAKTDQSARTAIRVGLIAIGIAILTPFIPVVIGYLSPDRTVPSIEALTREVIATRQAENAASDRLIKELAQSDDAVASKIAEELRQGQKQSADLLRDVLSKLSQRTEETAFPSPGK